MRKRKKGRKLHRKKDQRKALMISLANSLLKEGKIKTTEAKAKELSSFIEKKITKAKKEGQKAIRELNKFFSSDVSKYLVDEVAPKFKDRQGGYTRVIKLPPRKSDGAKRAVIELIND